MLGKISNTKFTIQFNRTDPSHIQVADILNRLERGGKAQYIVDAVMHYVNSGGAQELQRPHFAKLDEKHIEEIVGRLLRENQGGGFAAAPAPVSQSEPSQQIQPTEGVSFEEDMDALSEEGLGAIAGVLDMFKKR